MLAGDRPDLVGARWSSAVRCIARAEYQALGIQGDDDATFFLTEAFARGVNAADNWVQARKRYHEAIGDKFYTEVEIPWGPLGRWTGHADAVIISPGSEHPKLVVECYHSSKGEFREEKALQVAFYAHKLSESEPRGSAPYEAMLVALNTGALGDEGFETTPYAVDVQGLLPRVREIEAKIALAYAEEMVNLDDRVGDGPHHSECKSCPFREHCWADYEPPSIEENAAMADVLDRLILAQSNAAHLRAASDEAADLVRALKDQVRPFTVPGKPVQAGGIMVSRTLTAPRKSFRVTDYLKAGHHLTPTMLDFARESAEPGERWTIKRLDP